MSIPTCAECGASHHSELCTIRLAATPTPAAIALKVGDRVGNFQLTRVLGAGSASDVFLAENEVSEAVAAVKVLRPAFHESQDLVRRFVHLGQTTHHVRHEHVVEIQHVGLFQGWQHFIQMEHLDCASLAHLLEPFIATRGKLLIDFSRAVRIVLQLCSALGTAHSKGVVHGDVQPANIFVLERGGQPHVKLVDFGTARGIAAYMSPERIAGGEIDGRSDIFSLGVLMFRMATGQLPFESLVADQPPAMPRSLNPDISPEYEEIILRCLARSPSQRLQTMATVGRTVAAAVARPAVKTHRSTDVPPPQPSPRLEIDRDPSDLPTPSEGKPAARREARVRTAFGVQVFTALGALVGDAIVGDISLGGAFVRSSISLPLFSRVRVVGLSSAGLVDISGELVRLVMSGADRGFGVRFDPLTPQQRLTVEALTQPRTVEDGAERDPHAEAELSMFESRLSGDAYEMLGVPKDASTRRIRDVCERLTEEMALRHFPRLSASQARRLEVVTKRLAEAEQALVDPSHRALNDAVNGNVLGVLRCITEGFPLERLDELRLEFIRVRPDAQKLAEPALKAAAQAEQAGDVSSALGAIADALCHDPLNLGLHRRAADLRDRARTAATMPWAPAAPRP